MQSEGLGQRAVWSKGHLELAKPLSVVWRLQVTASGPMCMILPHISALNDIHICSQVATCTRSMLVNEATVLAIGSCCRKLSHRDQICLGLPKKRHYLPFHLHDPKIALQRPIISVNQGPINACRSEFGSFSIRREFERWHTS